MRKLWIILVVLVIFGCAKVSVETKEPIKVDINMRVDVYQHVVNDVESINDQIYGSSHKQLNAIFSIATAYAEDFSADVTAAISRRKARGQKIESYLAKGYIGENRNALLQVMGQAPAQERSEIERLVSEENKDRDLIYSAVAKKNETSQKEVRKVFFEDDYRRAPSGSWFEVYKDHSTYIWVRK